ncbi:MAG: DUF6020 family protein [Lachnospiraceae bacterium]|nr:DUF6020 family protein [Lachnospiraceae bacterium]
MIKKIDQYIAGMSKRRFFITAFFLLLLFWLPAWLALYPGTFGYDAPDQFWQYCGGKHWSSHHPVLHTFVMGYIIDETFIITQDNNDGLAIYSALQGLLSAWALAKSFSFLHRTKKIPNVLLLVLFLWTACNPNIQVLTFAATKDVVFGAFFVCFMVRFLDALADRMEETQKGRGRSVFSAVLLFLDGYLACMMRNQGIYIMLAALILLLLSDRKHLHQKEIRQALIIMGLVCLSVFGTGKFVANVLQIPGGNPREMLSVPMNQLAYTAKLDLEGTEDTMSEEELQQLETFLSEDAIRSYEADTADPVKSRFDTEAFLADAAANVRLYLQVGLHHPAHYLKALGGLIVPYWRMSLNRYRFLSMTFSFSDQYYFFRIQRRSKLIPYYNYLFKTVVEQEGIIYRLIAGIFSASWTTWILCFLTVFGLVRKKRDVLLTILLPGLYFGTCLLGPMALLRYLYPMLLAAPLLAGSLFRDR